MPNMQQTLESGLQKSFRRHILLVPPSQQVEKKNSRQAKKSIMALCSANTFVGEEILFAESEISTTGDFQLKCLLLNCTFSTLL